MMEKVINYFQNKYKGKKWSIFWGLAISFLLFELVFLFFRVDFDNLEFNDYLKIELIKYVFYTILLISIYHKYLKEKWFDFKDNIKEYWKISFKDWLTGFLIMIMANIIISSFITGLGENENAVQGIISKAPLIAFFMTTFFAPFIEEMIFRKSLQECFYNPIVYMVTSGFIFGLIHVLGASNPYEYLLIISYGALGLMFAKTLSKTDNIYCTIMMHMFHNGVLTILAMVI